MDGGMGYYDSNIYYSPEKFGLEIALEVEKEPNYDFTKLVVWRQPETDHYFWATDSGCSCPSPFETFKGIGDLAEVESAQQLHDELDDIALHEEYDYLPDGSWGPLGRSPGYGWTEEAIAEGHRKISELRIHPVVQGVVLGGYVIRGEIAA